MAVLAFSAQNFRCLCRVEFEPDPQHNLIVGPNASGKTSVLEALAYLGRGKSFRGATPNQLIRHGEPEFILFGRMSAGARPSSVGVRNGTGGLEVHVDGEAGGGAAALAEALPLQIIDPEIHNLVGGAPDARRRYLDWMAFHVEQGYLEGWRRFRRALRQRNAALKSGAGPAEIRGWDAEFCEYAAQVDSARRLALEVATAPLEETGERLLGSEVRFEYRPGWTDGSSLERVLESDLDRDRQLGSTQHGPHRGDLKLTYDARQARKMVSRGQQKLLGCAMVLAATETAQEALDRPLLLLLDDPAAELDQGSLTRLMDCVQSLNCQVIATSLTADTPIFNNSAAVFHVEQGRLRSA